MNCAGPSPGPLTNSSAWTRPASGYSSTTITPDGITGGWPLASLAARLAAIPSGAGVQIVATRNVGYYPQHQGPMAFFEWLVQPSPQCTGS